MTRFIAILALASVLLVPATASTFYIDYSSGADANTGTSKANSWKCAPCMKEFAGSCHNNPKT